MARRAVVWGLTLLWACGRADVLGFDLYVRLGLVALVVMSVLFMVAGPLLRYGLRPTRLDLAVGTSLGLILSAAAHVVCPLGYAVVPGLEDQVSHLYDGIHAPYGAALGAGLMLPVLFAEECLWRGALLGELGVGRTLARREATSVISYVLVQLPSGEPLLALIALTLGLVWTWERRFTSSLWAPIGTHLVFNLLVLYMFPVR